MNQEAKDDIQFLKELQQQMRWEDEHDYDGQASPRFWVVGDYEWRQVGDGCGERFSMYIPNMAECYEMEEFIKEFDIKEYDLSEDALEEFNELDTDSVTDFFEWFQEHIDDNVTLFEENQFHIIRPNTMFLTKEEAKNHIEINHYHYSSKAHTYAMTAWRAPKVERLLKILHDFDLEALENIEDDRTLFLEAYVDKVMKD